MARIRSIKPELFQDEKIAPLEPIDRLVFIGLISMADDAGRVLDSVKVIDAFIFPYTSHSARESLANLSRISRIRRGTTSSGQAVIQIVGWARHQRVDHPCLAAALPEIETETPPSQEDTNPREPIANGSREPRESVATDSRPISTTYDLRPTTNDHVTAVREKRTKAPPEKSGAGRETWLTPCARAWERRFGAGTFASKYGEAAKFLGPIASGGATPAAIGIALGNYCDANKLNKFMSIKHFAQHYQRWSGPLWEDGWLTELGMLVTAPPSPSNVA